LKNIEVLDIFRIADRDTFRFREIHQFFKLMKEEENYKSVESMRVSLIQKLNYLRKKGLVRHEEKGRRTYQITRDGIDLLAKNKLENMLKSKLADRLEKVF